MIPGSSLFRGGYDPTTSGWEGCSLMFRGTHFESAVAQTRNGYDQELIFVAQYSSKCGFDAGKLYQNWIKSAMSWFAIFSECGWHRSARFFLFLIFPNFDSNIQDKL